MPPGSWRSDAALSCLVAATAMLALCASPPAMIGEDLVSSLTPVEVPRLTAPVLRAEAIGPTQVRLWAEVVPGDVRYVYDIWATRTAADGGTGRRYFTGGQAYASARWTTVDGVSPDTTYRYRAYAESGIVGARRDSDWSNEVSVTTPSPPARPPAPPDDLQDEAAGPFRVALRWQDRSDNEYGFEIRKQVGEDWVRVLLVDPDTTQVILHGRTPDREARYRVRAFNVRGISADSNDAVVRTPALQDIASPRRPGAERPTPGPCSTRGQASREALEDEAGDGGTGRGERQVLEQELGSALDLVEYADPYLCGNANCSWVIYGTYGGCFRRLGETFGAGQQVVATTPGGLPVLIDIGHMSADQSSVGLMQLLDGAFATVDDYSHCAHGDADLPRLSPPFQGCQEDDDLWWSVHD